jgi:hypothetical protein
MKSDSEYSSEEIKYRPKKRVVLLSGDDEKNKSYGSVKFTLNSDTSDSSDSSEEEKIEFKPRKARTSRIVTTSEDSDDDIIEIKPENVDKARSVFKHLDKKVDKVKTDLQRIDSLNKRWKSVINPSDEHKKEDKRAQLEYQRLLDFNKIDIERSNHVSMAGFFRAVKDITHFSRPYNQMHKTFRNEYTLEMYDLESELRVVTNKLNSIASKYMKIQHKLDVPISTLMSYDNKPIARVRPIIRTPPNRRTNIR